MKKFSKLYPINFYHVGTDKRLTLPALMNLIQDIASDHAALLGFGHDHLDQDTYWVLVRQKIQMDYWPRWQDEVRIETFIAKADIGTPPRDLLIYHQDKIIGRGQTTWLVVDGKTRKIASQKIDLLLDASVEESSGVKTQKITIPQDGMQYLKTFVVEFSDLDMNFHVNNAIYGQWVIDSLDADKMKEWNVSEFSINYLQEILYEDHVLINRKMTLISEDHQEVLIEGKIKDATKAAFTALVKLVKKA